MSVARRRGETPAQRVLVLVALVLVGVTLLAGLAVCSVTTCSMMSVKDTCPHGPALKDLRVRAVTRDADGAVAVRLQGKRMNGLTDAYMYAATVEAEAGIDAEVEAGSDTIVVRLAEAPAAGTSRDVEVTLVFACRRDELGCGHPGRGDTHRLTIALTVTAEADAQTCTATNVTIRDEHTPPTGPG